MSSLHPPGAHDPVGLMALHACARQGCPSCTEQLLRHHEPLIHRVIARQSWGRWKQLCYADLVQEGRYALWRAIQHFNPTRGTPFAAYACTAIKRRIWLITFRARRQCPPRAILERLVSEFAAYADEVETCADPADLYEQREPSRLLLAAVQVVCDRSPAMWERALLAYGVDRRPEQSLAAVGRRYHVTREYLRQCREQILVRLRVRLILGGYLAVCGRETRATYQRFQALNRIAWRHIRYRQTFYRRKAAKARAAS